MIGQWIARLLSRPIRRRPEYPDDHPIVESRQRITESNLREFQSRKIIDAVHRQRTGNPIEGMVTRGDPR